MLKQLSVLLLFISINVIGQTNKTDFDTSIVETEFFTYIEALDSKNFDKVLDYLPENLFSIIPENQMLQVLKDTFDNPLLDFKYSNIKIISIDSPTLIDGIYYSSITYEGIIKLRFNNMSDDESEEDRLLRIESNKSYVDELFGKDVRGYNESTDFFDVYEINKGYAISNSDLKNWKFLVLSDSQELNKLILPEELQQN